MLNKTSCFSYFSICSRGSLAGPGGFAACPGSGFDPAEAEREAEAPLFEFFGLNTG